MEDSLQQNHEVDLQVDKIVKRFASDPAGPFNGSIHPAFQRPCQPNIHHGAGDVNQLVVSRSTTIHDQRSPTLQNEVRTQATRFRDAIRDYEQNAKEKYKTGVDLNDTHSVEHLWKIIDDVVEEYARKGQEGAWGKIRTGFRKLGDGSEAIQGWLGLLPTESEYLSVVCGGFKLILKAASRLRSIADKVLSELARIPAILSSVQRVLNIYPGSTKLVELSDAIYHSVLVALGRMLEYLKRKACHKFTEAFIKQDSFQSDLERAIRDIEVSRDDFNTEADMCQKEAIQTLQGITTSGGQQINDAILHLSRCITIARTEQERSNQKYQEYFDLMSHSYAQLMRYLFDTLKSNPKVDELAYNERKRLPTNAELAFQAERRPSLFDRMHKTQVRPSQARKTLLSRLDYDTEVAGKDVMSNFQNGPTLTKDEQERCRCAITSPKLTHWIESKRSSLLVINGNGTGPRKSGLSFLCARLVYSLDRTREDETDPKTIVRPEIVPIHFFCGQHLHNDRSKTWESPRGIVNSLLAQLIAQCKNIDVSKLKEARYTKLDKSKSKVKEVLQIFRLLIKQLPPHFAVFCVIDGLSFYANNDDISKATRLLVNGLLELFETSQEESKSHPVFKLLLTAPTTLRLDVVDDLDGKQVLNIPKRQPDKGGLNAIQWERELEKHLKEV